MPQSSTEKGIASSEICLTNLASENASLEKVNQAYTVLDEQEAPQFSVSGNEVVQKAVLPNQTISFDEGRLLKVLQATRSYFRQYGCQDLKVLRDGILGTQAIQISHILETLDFMIEVLIADLTSGQPVRLKNANFINKNFDVIHWLAYNPTSPSQTNIRITKYAVFSYPGSQVYTSEYNTPIYKLKNELATDQFYTRYTKQDVIGGIYEPGGSEFGKVEPLVYLTREGLEDALLQGSVLVRFSDGSARLFNVDKNNGIAYISGVSPWDQGRYWYFQEVGNIQGYGYASEAKIPIEPGVTFAGDILNIGLGKIIAIEDSYQNIRLGIIADTGGAFVPNLHQLDLFAGIFPDRTAYQQAVQKLPEYAKAYILLKKR